MRLDSGSPFDARPTYPDATATTTPDGSTAADGTPAVAPRNVLTGGSQHSRSGSHATRVSVGAPQPVGRTTGDGRVLTVGPQPSP